MRLLAYVSTVMRTVLGLFVLSACAKEPARAPQSRTQAILGPTSESPTNTALKSGDATSLPTPPSEPTGASTTPPEPTVVSPSTPVDQILSPEPMVVVSEPEVATNPMMPATPPPPPSENTEKKDPPPASMTPNFKKGDPFDSKVLKLSQMVAALLEAQKYSEATTPKAIAVNSLGLGMVSVLSSGASPADAKRVALEGCYVIGGFQPCALLVVENKFEADASSLSTPGFFTDTLPTPRFLNEVPFVDPALTGLMLSQYQAVKTFKAVAISLDGNRVAVTDSKLESIEEAKRLALERCELTAKLVPCFLFAVNDDIAFTPKSTPWNITLKFNAVQINTRGAVVPGVSADRLEELTDGINTYTDRVSRDAAGSGVVYLSKVSGNVGWSTPSYNLITGKDYKASALARCETFDGVGTCVPVIDKLSVSVTVADLAMATGPFRLAHCKAMPRTSCDAHRAAGCKDSGDYYVIDADFKVAAKPCTF